MWIKLGLNQNSSYTNGKRGDLEIDLETNLETDLETWQSDYKRAHSP